MKTRLQTVLLVDDDEPTLNAWERCFRRHSSRTLLRACSGATAAEHARRQPIDLAIVDQRLDGERGAAVIRELKNIQPGLRAILTSIDLSVGDMREAKQLDVEMFPKLPDWEPAITAIETTGSLADLPTPRPASEALTLEFAETRQIMRVMELERENISHAAEVLAMTRTGLQKKLTKLGLRPAKPSK
jgi:ActR/RegA family two-component response regulator